MSGEDIAARWSAVQTSADPCDSNFHAIQCVLELRGFAIKSWRVDVNFRHRRKAHKGQVLIKPPVPCDNPISCLLTVA